MPTTRSNATLRIINRGGGSAVAVTAALGIRPTRSHEVGDPRSKRNPKLWAHSYWGLDSDLPNDRDLREHLGQLCDLVEPKASALHALAADGYEVDLYCFVGVQHEQGGVILDAEILRRLSALPVALGLDIYTDDQDDE